jgi:uncharacterized protein
MEHPLLIFDPARKPWLKSDCDCSDCDCDCACATPTSRWYYDNAETHFGEQIKIGEFRAFKVDDELWGGYGSQCKFAVFESAVLDFLKCFAVPEVPGPKIFTWARHWGIKQTEDVYANLLHLGFLRPVSKYPEPENNLERVLTAWLEMTRRCNLNCSYCYVPRRNTREHCLDLSLETGKQIVLSIIRSAQIHGYRQVKIKYAGGEPLLCFSTVIALHTFAKARAQLSGLEIEGVVLTNGTLLTQSILEALQVADLKLVISLDQLASDKQPSARGMSALVEDAIELALAHSIRPHISVTVSGRNLSGLPSLISWLREHDLPFTLNFYRENEQIDAADLALKSESLISALRSGYRVIESNLPRWSVLNGLLDRVNLAAPRQRVCGAGVNYLAFDVMGQVGRCQMLHREKFAKYDHFDPLGILLKEPKGLQPSLLSERETCIQCVWGVWCGGGCPIVIEQNTGQPTATSPFCRVYKALVPDLLRLEAKRLLWQHGIHRS